MLARVFQFLLFVEDLGRPTVDRQETKSKLVRETKEERRDEKQRRGGVEGWKGGREEGRRGKKKIPGHGSLACVQMRREISEGVPSRD